MKGTSKKIIYILVIVIAIGILLFFCKNDIEEFIKLYSNTKEMEALIKSYGSIGPIIFIFLQILQVVVFFIPGEFMQAVGGYLFDTILGTVLSLLGIMVGSAITFLVSRKFGDRLLIKILPPKDYRNIKKLICKPKNKLVIFILYLLPGFPKDALGYVSGITTIKLKDFIIISGFARLPGILVTCYLGSNIYDKNYLVVLYILIGIAIILFIGIIKREKVLNYFK